MSNIHSTAFEGYKEVASTYNNGRPEYPGEAIAFIKEKFEITKGINLLDLGGASI
ncbi:MAG: hypothetical protein KDD45_00450 [Bdellovibrionales bacterium]|nr:hypothetical protein [Bdellovibrionales bacterium]